KLFLNQLMKRHIGQLSGQEKNDMNEKTSHFKAITFDAAGFFSQRLRAIAQKNLLVIVIEVSVV
ncbi:MAG TPA: hypothetical protein DDZ65_08010, partial [Firmicutes bacterium]|nr:hypothetical protein [Bacillota bacterium]